MRLHPTPLRNLHEPVGVGTVPGPHDENQVNPRRNRLDRCLPILGCVADVLALWGNDGRIALFEAGNYPLRIVDAQGRLGEVYHALGILYFQCFHIFDGRNQANGSGGLSQCADDFVMLAVANQHDGKTFAGVTDDLQMNLRNQGTSRINNAQSAMPRLLTNLRRYAVGTEDHHTLRGDIGQAIDENRPLSGEPVNNLTVVNDLLADKDRRPQFLQGQSYNVDGAHNSRTKTSRT